jgi:2-C-methyl-D-erythritol 2,4-cyclodiphosphate synthase
VGIGYDVHRLVEGRSLSLGGVEVPFEKGLLGWSDGDVLIHAIIDALLGATALGDIGSHFPPSEPAYKDISSLELLRRVGELLDSRGWAIGNIDATIIAEEPKLSPFFDKMRNNIAQGLNIDKACIGLKAKTSEGLDSLGHGEGIAAYAVASVEWRLNLRKEEMGHDY